MANTFSVGLTLPATRHLKIGWTETNAESFNLLAMQVKTENNAYPLVRTRIVDIQSDVDPLDIDTNYDVLINTKLVASWNNSLNRSAEWLLNCGPNSGSLCGPNGGEGTYYGYVIIDTSFWSASRRTISSISSSAIDNLTWVDLAQSEGTFQVYFNTAGGSIIDKYRVVLSGETIEKPTDPVKDIFVFDGWYKESDYQTPWDFETDTVTETLTLYAKWTFDQENFNLATTEIKGAVILSNTEHFDELEENDLVVTEEVNKLVLESLIEDIEEAIDEAIDETLSE